MPVLFRRYLELIFLLGPDAVNPKRPLTWAKQGGWVGRKARAGGAELLVAWPPSEPREQGEGSALGIK